MLGGMFVVCCAMRYCCTAPLIWRKFSIHAFFCAVPRAFAKPGMAMALISKKTTLTIPRRMPRYPVTRPPTASPPHHQERRFVQTKTTDSFTVPRSLLLHEYARLVWSVFVQYCDDSKQCRFVVNHCRLQVYVNKRGSEFVDGACQEVNSPSHRTQKITEGCTLDARVRYGHSLRKVARRTDCHRILVFLC